MAVTALQQQLDQQRQLNQQLQRDSAAAQQEIERLQSQLAIMQNDFHALMDSTEAVAKHRDQLEKLELDLALREELRNKREKRRKERGNREEFPAHLERSGAHLASL